MANIRRSAMGQPVDIDMLRLANEHTIAVGNTKTNARGDQLGPGGKVVKSRAQIMKDYHKLDSGQVQNIPVAESPKHVIQEESVEERVVLPTSNLAGKKVQDIPVAESSDNYVKPRGSFADAVAKQTEVTQELIDPAILTKDTGGIRRI